MLLEVGEREGAEHFSHEKVLPIAIIQLYYLKYSTADSNIFISYSPYTFL